MNENLIVEKKKLNLFLKLVNIIEKNKKKKEEKKKKKIKYKIERKEREKRI